MAGPWADYATQTKAAPVAQAPAPQAGPWADYAPSALPSANTQQLARTGTENIQSRPLAPIPGTNDSVDDGQGHYVGHGQPGYELAVDQAAQPKSNEALGFYQGLTKPIDNAAQGLEWLVNQGLKPFGGSTDAINHALGMPSAAQATTSHQGYINQQMAKGQTPGMIGNIAGQTVGTLPSLLEGPLVGGAMAGGLLSDAKDPLGLAASMGAGAAGGKLGEAVLGGLMNVASPKISEAAQMLLDKGIRLTPGQIMGGAVHRVESGLSSVPFLGDAINAGRLRSLQDFSKATVNDALGQMGEKLPTGTSAGNGAIDAAQQIFGKRYDALAPKLTASLDDGWASGVGGLQQDVSKLGGGYKREFNSILNDSIIRRANPATGTVDGQSALDAQEVINKAIKSAKGDQGPDARAYTGILQDLRGQLQGAIERGSPAVAPELAKINSAYRAYIPAETAAQSIGAHNGVATPHQYLSAIRSGDDSVRNRMFAAGNMQNQGFAQAGKEVLPSSVPDSGSPLRHLLELFVAGGVGLESHLPVAPLALGLAPSAMYTGTGQRIMQGLLTSRPYGRQAVESLLNPARPVASSVGAAITQPAGPGLLSLFMQPQKQAVGLMSVPPR
jgi:hypothetical protein